MTARTPTAARQTHAIAACVIFLGAFVLIATEKWVTRTAAALGGAALVLALGISDAEAAFFSDETGVDAGSTATGWPPPSTTAIPGSRPSAISLAAVNAGSSGPTVGKSCARSRALTRPP